MVYYRFVVTMPARTFVVVCRDGNAFVKAGVLTLKDMYGRIHTLLPNFVTEITEVKNV